MFTQYNLLKLSYKKKFFNSNFESRTTQIALNRIINLIHYYHINKKKILFVGFPKHLTEVLRKTKHTHIPETFLDNIPNGDFQNQELKIPKNISKLILDLKSNINLILIYNSSMKLDILTKSYLHRIPLVLIGKNFQVFTKNANRSESHYDLSIERVANLNVFYSLIRIIMNKK